MRDVVRDVARGLTVLEMEYVDHVDALRHAPVGSAAMTYSDTIFPMFTFLAGMGSPSPATSLTTIGLGLAYNTVKVVDMSWLKGADQWRVRPFGVLQRIGAAGLLLNLSPPQRDLSGFLFPVSSIALWLFLSLAFSGNRKYPYRSPDQSAQTRIDKWCLRPFGSRLYMYRSDYDPEGLLGTIMTSVSMWMGLWCAVNKLTLDEALITSISLMSFGHLFGYAFPRTCPMSKPYWTLSYALTSGGYSLFKYTLIQLAVPYLPAPVVTVLSCLGRKSLEVYFSSAVLDRSGLRELFAQVVGQFTSNTTVVQTVVTTAANAILAGLSYAYVRYNISFRLWR